MSDPQTRMVLSITRGTVDDDELAALIVALGVALSECAQPSRVDRATRRRRLRWQRPDFVPPRSWRASAGQVSWV